MAARDTPTERTDPSSRAPWMLVSVVIALIWGVSVLPGDSIGTASGLDTVGHVLEFTVLGATAARASSARSRAIIALTLALVVALGTEASQQFAVQRSADVGDVAADLLGALLGVAAWSAWAGPSRRG